MIDGGPSVWRCSANANGSLHCSPYQGGYGALINLFINSVGAEIKRLVNEFTHGIYYQMLQQITDYQ